MTTSAECGPGVLENAVLTTGLRLIVAREAKIVRHQHVGIPGIMTGLAIPLLERRVLNRRDQ